MINNKYNDNDDNNNYNDNKKIMDNIYIGLVFPLLLKSALDITLELGTSEGHRMCP